MKHTLLNFAVLAMMLLFSCTKPGPEGPAGKDGTNGINGTNGIDGKDGNANVIASNTIVLNNWVSVFDDGKNFAYTSSVSWASITQIIVDKGMVVVYLQAGSNWIALPFTDAGVSGTLIKYYYSSTLNYSIGLGEVTLLYNGFDELGSPGVTSVNGDTIRIVAIPSSVVAANPNIDWHNYEDAMKILK